MGEGWIQSGDPVAPKTICGRSPTHHLLGMWHTPFYKAVEKWGVPRAILVCRVGGLLTYANTKYLQHDIPFWCVVLEVNRHTPTQYTSNTTYHFGVSCWRFTDIRQHKIPPTRHTILVCRVGGLPTYANTKYLQHDIPLLCRVGGLLTYTNTKYLQRDIPFWCVVLEVNRHTPTQYTSNTTYHFGVSCWRFTDIRQHKIPPTRHTIGVSCM